MPITLDYVRPAPWYKQRRTRRALIVLLAAILLAILVYFSPTLWRRITILYYQGKCMNHSDAEGAIVAELSLDNLPSGAPAPDCKNYLDAIGPAARGTYLVAGRSLPLSREGRIFLHARTSPGGTRLITVDFDVVTDPPSSIVTPEPMSNVAFCATVINPGTLFADPEFISDDRLILLCGGEVLPQDPPSPRTLVIYAGQPDSADAAAFSINLLFYGRPHTAKFRLNDTADKIEFLSFKPIPTDRF